jgi:hypothetical protein
MKIEELRIGSFVLEFGEVTQIVQLDRGGKTFYRINDMQVNKESFLTDGKVAFEPIPLTEEWLLKFGFNKDYKQGYIGKDFSNLDFVLTELFVMGEWQKGYAFQFSAGGWSRYKEFNFVHELQDFYFAMTGEELELSGD